MCDVWVIAAHHVCGLSQWRTSIMIDLRHRNSLDSIACSPLYSTVSGKAVMLLLQSHRVRAEDTGGGLRLTCETKHVVASQARRETVYYEPTAP